MALQKQAHLDKGYLANEEIERAKTQRQIDKFQENNIGDYKAWEPESDRLWGVYEKEQADRVKTGNGSRSAVNGDVRNYQLEREASRITTQAAVNVAQIAESNENIIQSAYQYYEMGDVTNAVKKVYDLNASTADKTAQALKMVAESENTNFALRVSEALELAPTEQKKVLNDIAAELSERDPEENFVNGQVLFENPDTGEIVNGGILMSDRVAFRDQALKLARSAQNAMERNAYDLVPFIKSGDSVDKLIAEGVAAGKFDAETIAGFSRVFDIEEGIYSAKQEDLRNKEDEAKRNRLIAYYERERTLSGRILNGTATEEDISQQVELGLIRPESVEGLTNLVNQRAANEAAAAVAADAKEAKRQSAVLNSLDADFLNGDLSTYDLNRRASNEGLSEAIVKAANERLIASNAMQRSGQMFTDLKKSIDVMSIEPSPSDYNNMVRTIAESELTKDNRIFLLGRMLHLKIRDFEDNEEDVEGTLYERDISNQEKRVRTNLMPAFYFLANVRGVAIAGDIYFQQEEELKKMFSEPVTDEEAETIENRFRKIIYEAGASMVLSEIAGISVGEFYTTSMSDSFKSTKLDKPKPSQSFDDFNFYPQGTF
tara:strand:- start:6927 stop:8735 length:1809 start_codon:yes stop_codon:yes gene_type:complete